MNAQDEGQYNAREWDPEKGASHDNMSNIANLSEVAAPPPEQNTQEEDLYRRQSLEESRSRPSNGERISKGSMKGDSEETNSNAQEEPDFDYSNLAEVAAPPPDQNPTEGAWYRRQSLEQSQSRQREESRHRPYSPGQRHRRNAALFDQLYTISYLVLFSILGTLARLGVQAITHYPNAPILFGEMWANVGGSFFIGFLQEEEWFFAAYASRLDCKAGEPIAVQSDSSTDTGGPDERKKVAKDSLLKVKKTLPLYIGLSVGFCGSFTSFSSFIRDSFLALSNDLTPQGSAYPGSRDAAWSLPAVLAVLITEIGLCMSALSAGAHTAIGFNCLNSRLPRIAVHWLNHPVLIVFSFGCWIGSIIMAIWPPHQFWRRKVIFALVFAPVGCLLRFFLALRLNKISLQFPVGTFAANMFGTLILGACWDLQHVPLSGAGGDAAGSIVGCQVLQGVQDGFCGCLTTVSTWATELKGLRRKHSYIYGTASVAIAFAALVVIMGPVRWTHIVLKVSC